MKKLTIVMLLAISSVGFAQTTFENGWGVGVVLTSPGCLLTHTMKILILAVASHS